MARPHASRVRAMALAHPHGELGHIRPKLPSNMAPPRPLLSAPTRLARWSWCVRAVARVTLGRNSSIKARPLASGRASTRPWLMHTKECFQTLFLITLSHNTNPHPLSNSIGLNGNDNGANSDDEHTKDRISSRLYTCAQRTVTSSSVECANTKDNNSGLF
ncbi:hypothetical protein PIB30_075206 [Stylosanthes scabra]|uniref:Uncharacterized protein n=1 Tax=Stylosanthes scabra TaxID=79078 RepID=A0ABU6QQZ9_9FABA|nr:hypothetical protein [Stylosanthes scabra]